jgi:predicted GIY-YIG superfamily endonuclease
MPPFHHVYLLRSTRIPDNFYVGLTKNLQARLRRRNTSGTPHSIAP